MDKIYTATAYIFEDDRILLIKHKAFGVWLPPGGHVEPSETHDAACLREVYEETGLLVEILSSQEPLQGLLQNPKALTLPFSIHNYDKDGDGSMKYVDFAYICKIKGGEISLQEDEVGGISWFTQSQVATIESFDNVRSNIDIAFKIWNLKKLEG